MLNLRTTFDFFDFRRVRHARQVLRGVGQSEPPDRVVGRERVRPQAQDGFKVHEDEEHRPESHRRHLRFLPRLQVPGLHGSPH